MCSYDHNIVILTEENRHYVSCPKYNNCVICLSENEGAMTQAQIGDYLGLSKMRICQIEKKAIEKFKKRMNKILN